MGQYHSIYNKTAKETFCLGSVKLWGMVNPETAAALKGEAEAILRRYKNVSNASLILYPQEEQPEGIIVARLYSPRRVKVAL